MKLNLLGLGILAAIASWPLTGAAQTADPVTAEPPADTTNFASSA